MPRILATRWQTASRCSAGALPPDPPPGDPRAALIDAEMEIEHDNRGNELIEKYTLLNHADRDVDPAAEDIVSADTLFLKVHFSLVDKGGDVP